MRRQMEPSLGKNREDCGSGPENDGMRDGAGPWGKLNHALNALADKADKRAGKFLSALFYIGLTIELVIVIVDKSALSDPYEGRLFQVTFVFFLLKLLSVRFTPKERGWLIFLLVLSLVSYEVTGRNQLLRFTVFAASMVRMDIRRIMKYTLFFSAAGCILLNILSLFGILGTVTLTTDYGEGMETRWCLGLGHPNSLHCMAAMLVILFLYLYQEKMRVWLYVVLLMWDMILYEMTKSQMGAIAMGGAILLSFLFRYCRGRKGRPGLAEQSWIYIAGEVLMAAGFVFSFLAATFNPWYYPLMGKLDALMTGRIASLWESTFHEGTLATWKWFSERGADRFFDLGWVRTVYWYGVIPAAVIIYLIFKWMALIRRRRDAAAFSMLFILVVYTVFEAHLVSEYIGRNYLFMLAALYVPAAGGERKNALKRG